VRYEESFGCLQRGKFKSGSFNAAKGDCRKESTSMRLITTRSIQSMLTRQLTSMLPAIQGHLTAIQTLAWRHLLGSSREAVLGEHAHYGVDPSKAAWVTKPSVLITSSISLARLFVNGRVYQDCSIHNLRNQALGKRSHGGNRLQSQRWHTQSRVDNSRIRC